jgi:hypothetical protein
MDILQLYLNQCFHEKYIKKFPSHFLNNSIVFYLKEDITKKLPTAYLNGQPVILDPDVLSTYHSMRDRFVRDCVEKIVNSISTEVDI